MLSRRDEAEVGALALRSLSRNSRNHGKIAETGAIQPLVALLRNGTDESKEMAAGALYSLACTDDNEVLIARAGAIPPLVALLRNGTDESKATAAGVLEKLAYDNDKKVSIARAGAISPLVFLVQNGSEKSKEKAAGALAALVAIKETKEIRTDAAKQVAVRAMRNLFENDDSNRRSISDARVSQPHRKRCPSSIPTAGPAKRTRVR